LGPERDDPEVGGPGAVPAGAVVLQHRPAAAHDDDGVQPVDPSGAPDRLEAVGELGAEPVAAVGAEVRSVHRTPLLSRRVSARFCPSDAPLGSMGWATWANGSVPVIASYAAK